MTPFANPDPRRLPRPLAMAVLGIGATALVALAASAFVRHERSEVEVPGAIVVAPGVRKPAGGPVPRPVPAATIKAEGGGKPVAMPVPLAPGLTGPGTAPDVGRTDEITVHKVKTFAIHAPSGAIDPSVRVTAPSDAKTVPDLPTFVILDVPHAATNAWDEGKLAPLPEAVATDPPMPPPPPSPYGTLR